MLKETMIIIFLYHHIARLNNEIDELNTTYAFLAEDCYDLKEDIKHLKKKLTYDDLKHITHACP